MSKIKSEPQKPVQDINMTYSGSPNSYFKQLPRLDYPSLANDRNSAYDYQIVKNIFKRAVLRDDVFDEVTAFERY